MDYPNLLKLWLLGLKNWLLLTVHIVVWGNYFNFGNQRQNNWIKPPFCVGNTILEYTLSQSATLFFSALKAEFWILEFISIKASFARAAEPAGGGGGQGGTCPPPPKKRKSNTQKVPFFYVKSALLKLNKSCTFLLRKRAFSSIFKSQNAHFCPWRGAELYTNYREGTKWAKGHLYIP